MLLYPLLYIRIIWALSKFPLFGLPTKKLSQSFQGVYLEHLCCWKVLPGNSETYSGLRTIEMWILKLTLLKQSRVYALFFASQLRKSGWHLFFSSLAPGCSRNRTMDSNDSFLTSVGKTKDELLSWSPWQLLLFNANYTNLDILPFQTYLPNGTPLSGFHT